MGRVGLIALFALLLSGCRQGPFAGGPQGAFWRQSQEQPAYVAQLQELDQRNRKLDTNNTDLHKQLAQTQQQLQVMQQDRQLLRKQLDDTANQLETVLAAKQDAERRIETLQASTRFRGGATITANSSLQQSLADVAIPGLQVRRDGDVLRIEIPADQLFRPGTVQFQPQFEQVLDNVAQAINTNFPRQVIAIEAHTDSASLGDNIGSLYQLSASQSLAIFDYLTKRAKLPEKQLFTIAFGPNQPALSNGTPGGRERNRRIEIVIYPDTI